MSTEIIEEDEEEEEVKNDGKEDSPVPPEEAEKLLKIVEDHEKQEVNKVFNFLYNYTITN